MAKSPFTDASGTKGWTKGDDAKEVTNEELWDNSVVWMDKWDGSKTVVNTGDGDDTVLVHDNGKLTVSSEHYLLTFKGDDSIIAGELMVAERGTIKTGSGKDHVHISEVSELKNEGLLATGSNDDIVYFQGHSSIDGSVNMGSGDDTLIFSILPDGHGRLQGGSGVDTIYIEDPTGIYLGTGEYLISDVDIQSIFGDIEVDGFEKLALGSLPS